jgi:hypothetical protein
MPLALAVPFRDTPCGTPLVNNRLLSRRLSRRLRERGLAFRVGVERAHAVGGVSVQDLGPLINGHATNAGGGACQTQVVRSVATTEQLIIARATGSLQHDATVSITVKVQQGGRIDFSVAPPETPR